MVKFSKKFEQLIDFINFTHEFQEIIRVARPPYRKRMENDAEHSYQLAMVAWFLIDQEKLKLDKELCFMYALAHDLVEIYAGDTFTFDKAGNASKHQREVKALIKIKKRFSHFDQLTKIIEQFEKKDDEESRFIYALDKIIPPIQCYFEEGLIWKKHKTSLKDLLENKSHKIAYSKTINTYWQELIPILEKEENRLFKKKSSRKFIH